MDVERVSEPTAAWREFVATRADACLGHDPAWWRVMRDAYGLEPCYLQTRDTSGTLRGVLPMVAFQDLRGRRELVSLPFLDGAGILADDPEAVRSLFDAALELARETKAVALELRQTTPLQGLGPVGALDRVDLVLALEADEEAQWKALPGKARNQTRKAGREGIELGEDTLDGFYRPFATNMRDLGSPVHGRDLFREALAAFGDRLRCIVCVREGRPVGGLVAIAHGGTVYVPWASTLRSERSRCPNNLIYWEAIRWAVSRGARQFDFGRSPIGSGTHRFKRGWGADERPLAWVRFDPGGAPLPIEAAAESPVLRGLSRLWMRLPVALASAMGPRIRRRISS